MRPLSLTIFPLLLPAFLAAQSDSVRSVIEGKVRDLDGRPVSEVEILWRKGPLSALSRADGSFSLVIPARGEAVILVRKPGFSAQALRVNLTDRASWRGDILLQAGSYRLPDIEVEARFAKPAEYAGTTKYDGFFRRQRLGLGKFVSREQIEKLNAFHTIEILRAVPGMYVNPGNPGDPSSADIRIPRCGGQDSPTAKVTVWIDGVMQKQPHELARDNAPTGRQQSYEIAALIGRLGVSQIEMVEVFLGASQIPAEYHWDGCGVIAIWTRWNRE